MPIVLGIIVAIAIFVLVIRSIIDPPQNAKRLLRLLNKSSTWAGYQEAIDECNKTYSTKLRATLIPKNRNNIGSDLVYLEVKDEEVSFSLMKKPGKKWTYND